jgi:hypothetical protein
LGFTKISRVIESRAITTNGVGFRNTNSSVQAIEIVDTEINQGIAMDITVPSPCAVASIRIITVHTNRAVLTGI